MQLAGHLLLSDRHLGHHTARAHLAIERKHQVIGMTTITEIKGAFVRRRAVVAAVHGLREPMRQAADAVHCVQGNIAGILRLSNQPPADIIQSGISMDPLRAQPNLQRQEARLARLPMRCVINHTFRASMRLL